MDIRVAIGQDSHRFADENTSGRCLLGGVAFEDAPPFLANSDGDVVLHAVTNAVSGITCRNVLGARADEMCRAGITDSAAYLAEAMKDLREVGYRVAHLSVSIEGARPKISPKVEEMRESLGKMLGVDKNCVGVTATTGEGLTAFGRGEGVSVFCVLTAKRECEEDGRLGGSSSLGESSLGESGDRESRDSLEESSGRESRDSSGESSDRESLDSLGESSIRGGRDSLGESIGRGKRDGRKGSAGVGRRDSEDRENDNRQEDLDLEEILRRR